MMQCSNSNPITQSSLKWDGDHLSKQKSGTVVMLCLAGLLSAHLHMPKVMVSSLILIWLLTLRNGELLPPSLEKNTITNERAIILIADVHCFFVGLCATIAPLPFGDPLLLDPNAGDKYERAAAKEPYGVIPAFKAGITDEAEMYNGRLAMLGLVCLGFTSLLNGVPMIDVVNEWVGGAYY